MVAEDRYQEYSYNCRKHVVADRVQIRTLHRGQVPGIQLQLQEAFHNSMHLHLHEWSIA